MINTLNVTIGIQALTFVVAATLFIREGSVKLGVAQALLAVITWLIYA